MGFLKLTFLEIAVFGIKRVVVYVTFCGAIGGPHTLYVLEYQRQYSGGFLELLGIVSIYPLLYPDLFKENEVF